MKMLLLVLILALFRITSCSSGDEIREPITPPEKLSDLAYNVQNTDNRVYIVEDGEYVPYLVLTDDYNGAGNCLLLREYLLDEERPYNDPDLYYPSYYEDSWIDQYLNQEFYPLLSDFVASHVIDSSIVITATESLEYAKEYTTTIQRKVFLLSYAELNRNARTILKEGEPLKYFEDWKNCIAYSTDGRARNWWLRTPSTTDRYLACVAASDGSVGSAGILNIGGFTYSGTRPAFCLPGDLPVIETNINGTMSLILKGDTLLK